MSTRTAFAALATCALAACAGQEVIYTNSDQATNTQPPARVVGPSRGATFTVAPPVPEPSDTPQSLPKQPEIVVATPVNSGGKVDCRNLVRGQPVPQACR